MSRTFISLAAPAALLACTSAAAEPLPARLDSAAISAHQQKMANTDTRVWGVNIADASGAVDGEPDMARAARQGPSAPWLERRGGRVPVKVTIAPTRS